MDKTTKLFLGIVIVGVVVAGVHTGYRKDRQPSSQNSQESSEPIKIGWIGPLTGDVAKVGENAKAATEVAAEEINNTGGINGRRLEFIYEDGKCTGKDAASAASKLINIDKVPVILGGACSGETTAFANLAEQSRVVTLSYCSSTPALSEAGDYIFRNYPSDSFQGKFAADYIYNKLGKKRVAVLYGQTDGNRGNKDVFVKQFKQLGGEVLAEEGFEQTDRDFRTQLSKIKSVYPDLLYFLGYAEPSVSGLRQAAEIKLNLPIFGSDAWDDTKLLEQVGSAGEGIMYSVPMAKNSQTLKTKLQAKSGSDEVIACSPTAYDAVKIIAQVMNKVGTNSTAIKEELYKTTYTGGVASDSFSFDQNGDPASAEYVVKVVRNGKAEELK